MLRPQITPPASTALYARCLIFVRNFVPSGSDGISTQFPSTSYFQPWARAPEPALLVSTEVQRRRAVAAELVEKPETALGVAERDQLLPQELDPYRVAVWTSDLLSEQGRYPIPPGEGAHRGSGAGAGEQFVLFTSEHCDVPSKVVRTCEGGVASARERKLRKADESSDRKRAERQ